MRPLRIFCAVAALLVWAPLDRAAAQSGVAVPAGVQRVTSVEGITEYQLQNGLRVLLFPDQSKSSITVNVTYLVGSRHENYGETGMAHLLEHMVFKGSTRHPNIPKELQDHGSRPNGTTSYDRTNYFETFSATDGNLEWALDLESDRMVNSFISKSDLDSEMTVVRNEFEAGENDPGSIIFERALSTAYLWHNYGKSTIGARSDLENVPIDRLQAFYKAYYQPDNAILLVAGRIDEAKTLGLVSFIGDLVLAAILASGGWLLADFFPLRDGAGGPPYPVSRDEIRRLLAPQFVVVDEYAPETSAPGREGLEWMVTARRS